MMWRSPGQVQLLVHIKTQDDVTIEQTVHLESNEYTWQAAHKLIALFPNEFNQSHLAVIDVAISRALQRKISSLSALNDEHPEALDHWQQKILQQRLAKKDAQSESVQVEQTSDEMSWPLMVKDAMDFRFDAVLERMNFDCQQVVQLVQEHSRKLSAAAGTNGHQQLAMDLRSELEQLHMNQKQAFKQFILLDNQSNGDGADDVVVDQIADDLPLVAENIDQEHQVNNAVELRPQQDLLQYESIVEMGFSVEQAKCALVLSENNAQQAVVILLEQPERVQTILDRQRQVRSSNKTPTAQSPQIEKRWNPAKQFMESNQATMRKLGNWIDKAKSQLEQALDDPNNAGSGSSANAAQPSPITTRSSQATAPNEKSQDGQQIVKKRQVSVPSMVESFTITLGTHIQYSHQMRLSVSKYGDLVRHSMDQQERAALRAQTFATLFSGNRLVAMVMFVARNEWSRYKNGRLNDTFYRSCMYETEYLFDDVKEQVKVAEQLFTDSNSTQKSDEQSLGCAVEGDFFITRHSNLPLVSIVFHMVVDDPLNSPLTHNSAAIAGLRNIFGVASKYGVHELILPVMLMQDYHALLVLQQQQAPKKDSTSSPHSRQQTGTLTKSSSFSSLVTLLNNATVPLQQQSQVKDATEASLKFYVNRAELILKTIKICWLEQTRLEDRAVEVVKLVVPPQLASTHPSLFFDITASIRAVFKTT